ncbi:hypothetical protein LTR84_012739 [Exophiala bonariae]|uniref:Wings apart-like protein C-terminal domain-containing protein n=1 Tax=Exophiala bonariae TaxID=1690606 RepID=A0AAV9NIJ6_9EURO|nr:hypothetical protein LTR84_012739 [Exophiala bonariae]
MSGKQFHFLSPSVAGVVADQKVAAAARSEARSHAAKVSYPEEHRVQRRSTGARLSAKESPLKQGRAGSKDSQSDQQSDTSSSESITSSQTNVSNNPKGHTTGQPNGARVKVLKFRQYERKDRSRKKAVPKANPTPAKVPRAISKSTLDPFVKASISLSVPDEHLLHLYLSTVPDEVYGKSSGSASEVVREGTLAVIARNDIVLMWLLLTIESQVVSFQPSKMDKRLSILTRRAQAYKLMKEKLDNDANASLDFAFTVSVASSCEMRMGNLTGAEQHIAAVKKLLSLHGGSIAVRTITYPLGLMVVNSLVELGRPGLFNSRLDLRDKLRTMTCRLHDYQAWNHSLRSEISPHSPMSIQNCLSPSSDEDLADDSWGDALRRRTRAFSTDSALGKYVALPSTELDDATYRFLLGVLYVINTAFWDFRDSPSTSNDYLGELMKSVELSIAANFVLRAGGSKLPSLLMLMMLAHKAAKDDGRDASTSVVFHDEEVFEFVNLVMMSGPIIRMRVLSALYSWLVTSPSTVDDLFRLGDVDFNILRREVEDVWVSDQARRLANLQLS